MLITCGGEVVTLRPDEGAPKISGCDGILSPKMGMSLSSSRYPSRMLRQGVDVLFRADMAELLDGDATEGGCGGGGRGREALGTKCWYGRWLRG